MGIQVGGIDLMKAVINAELRISVLEKTVEALLNKRPITPEDLEKFRAETLADLQRRYPDAGIRKIDK